MSKQFTMKEYLKKYNDLDFLNQVHVSKKNEIENQLRKFPFDANLYFYLAIIECKKNNFAECLHLLNRAIQLYPNNPLFNLLAGFSLICLGKPENSLIYLNNAEHLDPQNPAIYFHRANAYNSLGKIDETIKDFEKTITLDQSHFRAFMTLGKIEANKRNFEKAYILFDYATRIEPKDFEAQLTKGSMLTELRHFAAAYKTLNVAKELKKDNYEINSALANVFLQTKDFDNAEKYYKQNFKINKKDFSIVQGLALCYDATGKIYETIKVYKEFINHNPDSSNALVGLAHTGMIACDWENLEARKEKIYQEILQKNYTNPFPVINLFDNQKLQTKSAKSFCLKGIEHYKFTKKNKNPKIKIGYYSPDFRNHPVSYLIARMIELHDREKFEVHAFSLIPGNNDEMRKRMENAFDHFHDVFDVNSNKIAETSRSHGIDIAIDLAGYTADNRNELFHMGLAPLQINFLGFPGSMAARCYDYIVGDSIIINESNRKYFSENVISLPCYMPNDDEKKISDKNFVRADMNLPESAFVFCCFNQSYKFNPQILNLWATILNSVENSVLWLSKTNEFATKNLIKEFKNRGLSSDRLIFAERTQNIDDHLRRIQLADLFLDTSPYNAHTTASDALWVGVPVLTKYGHSFASRVASSLLNRMNVKELIAKNDDDYVQKAVEIGQDRLKLSLLKEIVNKPENRERLFNTVNFTRQIEKAYECIYNKYINGEEKSDINID